MSKVVSQVGFAIIVPQIATGESQNRCERERYINSLAVDLIIGRMVQTALADYRGKRYCPGKPDAGAFLIAAGIVDPETGVIDYHGYAARLRPSHARARTKEETA